MSTNEKTPRIVGFDLARALAILGMCVVHFTLVMSSARKEPVWLFELVGLLDGRAAALFVILAGIGVSLRTRRALLMEDPHAVRLAGRSLVRRGVVLLLAGFLNLLIWQGDILRIYGVSMLVASLLLGTSDRWLLGTAIGFIVVFFLLFITVDYSTNWDWDALEYHGLWCPEGIIRNLFYDGFRSVFPWTGLFLMGMWLGRNDWTNPALRRRMWLVAVTICIATEIISRFLISRLTANPSGMDSETISMLFGTESMPPLLLFLSTAIGFAVAAIVCCLWLAERFAGTWLIRSLVATGQMALTWYIGHIVFGLGFVVVCGWTEDQPLAVSSAAALGFFGLAMATSLAWRNSGRLGPLEWLVRRVAA